MKIGSVQDLATDPNDSKTSSMDINPTVRQFELPQMVVSLMAIAVLLLGLVTVAAGLWVRHIVRVSESQRPPVTSMNAPVT